MGHYFLDIQYSMNSPFKFPVPVILLNPSRTGALNNLKLHPPDYRKHITHGIYNSITKRRYFCSVNNDWNNICPLLHWLLVTKSRLIRSGHQTSVLDTSLSIKSGLRIWVCIVRIRPLRRRKKSCLTQAVAFASAWIKQSNARYSWIDQTTGQGWVIAVPAIVRIYQTFMIYIATCNIII